jgi:hypothetical protein
LRKAALAKLHRPIGQALQEHLLIRGGASDHREDVVCPSDQVSGLARGSQCLCCFGPPSFRLDSRRYVLGGLTHEYHEVAA